MVLMKRYIYFSKERGNNVVKIVWLGDSLVLTVYDALNLYRHLW